MHPTDTNFQKLTGEWNKHINKRLKKLYNKKRRAFLKKCLISWEYDIGRSKCTLQVNTNGE